MPYYGMDDFMRNKLVQGLEKNGFQGGVDFEGVEASYQGKIRLGAVLDDVMRVDAACDGLVIGGYRLDIYTHILSDGAGAEISLTEKESALLRLLHEAGGVVSRERILREVWEYGDGVETHTLETHIYRLRQKIEGEPSEPRILKTADDGYYLADD